MRADFDSKANALSIDLVDAPRWEGSESVGQRVNVSFAEGKPVNVELLYPDMGLEGPLNDAAVRYDLDLEALVAAAKAAIAAPDRSVRLDVGARAPTA